MNENLDVVIVGAGPVGLLMAIELNLAGASVRVLERLTAPSTAMKAKSVGPLASEAIQRRGMRAALMAEEERSFAAIQQFIERNGPDPRGRGSQFIGHFAGLPIRKTAGRNSERRGHAVDQHGLETMLAERARTLGIDLHRAVEVTGLTQHPDGIEVQWTSPEGEGQTQCGWLVGCDGGRSFIRKAAGFDFPGTPPTSTFYQIIADIDHPGRLLPNGWNRTAEGVFSYGPIAGRLVLIDFSGPPADRETPVTREEIEAVVRRISGADVRVNALKSASRWGDTTRLVDHYRRGRVLLAGDAAHVHPPFGGQGLSLGLCDAANLGWKLAAIIRGDMPESLLDTYAAERRPVAEAVLSNTLAQMAIMRPDPQSGALRDFVAKLLQSDEVSRIVGETMSGLSARYDLGSEKDEVGRLIGDRPIGAGASLYDVMRDGSGVLLDASSRGHASSVAASTPTIRCINVDTGPSMLIRPDGCIAWVGDNDSTDGLQDALRRWFVPARDQMPGVHDHAAGRAVIR